MPAIVYPCQCGCSGEPALGAIHGTVNTVFILVSAVGANNLPDVMPKTEAHLHLPNLFSRTMITFTTSNPESQG